MLSVTNLFCVGDTVRLSHGTAPLVVTKVYKHHLDADYLSTNHQQKFRPISDFVHFEKEETTMSKQLYKVIGKEEIYGHFLTNNSVGQTVLELVGKDGGVKAFNADEIEEVRPYTVEIQFSNGQSKHYVVKEGTLEPGDVTVTGIHLGRVSRIDTKSRNPLDAPKDLRKVATTSV